MKELLLNVFNLYLVASKVPHLSDCVRACVCLQPEDTHATTALLAKRLDVCVCVCAREHMWYVRAVVTSYRSPQHQTHILKVTNQARWPLEKIKDMFLKKETPLIYHILPVATVISATEGRW